MRGAGYDVERGQKGSTAQNLSVLKFKTEAEIDRLAELVVKTAAKEGLLPRNAGADRQYGDG